MFASPTLIGESFNGSGGEAAHLNVVIGRRGSPVETAWASSLAAPRAGHIPFVTVLQPGLSDPVHGGGRTPVVTAAALILLPGTSTAGGIGSLPLTPSVAPIVLVPGGSWNGTFSGQPFALPPISIRLEAE